MVEKSCEIGIIGGSGVYSPEMLEGIKELKVSTPFGRPSDLISIGSLQGRSVAFIPRHGKEHQIPPHRVPYRANIWALKELGVKRVISASAVGSLREDYRPSELVLVDQFIDRTKWRDDTFYEGGRVCHISTADPFCAELREIFIKSASGLNISMHDRGTYVCIQGPRFSTRAESRLFRSWGVDVIGMTLCPEVVLAREAELCYVSVTMVTDYDVWAEKPVSADDVQRTMAKNSENFSRLLVSAVPKIPAKRSCECGSALRSAFV